MRNYRLYLVLPLALTMALPVAAFSQNTAQRVQPDLVHCNRQLLLSGEERVLFLREYPACIVDGHSTDEAITPDIAEGLPVHELREYIVPIINSGDATPAAIEIAPPAIPETPEDAGAGPDESGTVPGSDVDGPVETTQEESVAPQPGNNNPSPVTEPMVTPGVPTA